MVSSSGEKAKVSMAMDFSAGVISIASPPSRLMIQVAELWPGLKRWQEGYMIALGCQVGAVSSYKPEVSRRDEFDSVVDASRSVEILSCLDDGHSVDLFSVEPFGHRGRIEFFRGAQGRICPRPTLCQTRGPHF